MRALLSAARAVGVTRRGAGHGAGQRIRRGCALGLGSHELGQAEVQDLHRTIGGDEQVLGLKVAVDDAAAMRRRQPTRNLDSVVDHFAQRQRGAREALAQRVAVQQLGDHVAHAVVCAHVQDRHQVRVIQRARSARFLIEPAQALGLGVETRVQHLDGDFAVHRVSEARYTSPIAPAPRSARIR